MFLTPISIKLNKNLKRSKLKQTKSDITCFESNNDLATPHEVIVKCNLRKRNLTNKHCEAFLSSFSGEYYFCAFA